MSRHSSGSAFHKSKTLNDKYMLGDEIGKGAYGRVYKGLDLENGDFVAIKQVSLENIPPEDLASIMSEIDLLKNLNHRNIVKYQGSFKTKTHLYIILEFVENGSLANNIKPNKFGALPENVVGRYIAQVLEGLVYLHEQGVIHRDIKGANILTTKEGEVKLADFGVATKLTEADINTHSVVGTPYWMAPEVIEMSGVSAASDIWSVGCTVIELLTCVPPYYDLQPMPALFRIVQDDHPPLPEHISEVITDFLRQCFQKDAKRRPDAKTLLGHAWIRKSRRDKANGRNGVRTVAQESPSVEDASGEESRPQNSEPVSEERNATRDPFESGSDDGNSHSPTTSYEASSSQSNSICPRAPLRIPSHGVAHFPRLPGSHDQDLLETNMSGTTKRLPPTITTPLTRPPAGGRVSESPESIVHNAGLQRTLSGTEGHAQFEVSGMRSTSEKFTHLFSQEDGEVNGSGLGTEPRTWKKDDHGMKLEANGNHFPTQGGKASSVHPSKSTDLIGDGPLDANTNDAFFGIQEASTLAPAATNHGLPPRGSSSLETHVTVAKIKAKTAQKRVETESLLTARPNGYESSVDTEDDDSVRTGLGMVIRAEGREYLAKQALEVSRLMAMMKADEAEEVLLASCQKLSSIFHEFPMQKKDLMMPHGIIPLMDMLDVNNNRVVYAVLQVLNLITDDNVELLESACHAGLIPIMMKFANPDCSKEMRMQAAYFVQKLCHKSALTLQMFIACRGLPVLVGFLETDYAKYREMVHLAIDCIWQVLDLPGISLKNDFCHIFARSSVLARSVDTLHNLNEAARMPSASVHSERPRQHSSEKVSVKSQTSPIDPSRIINKEVFRSRSGQLDQTRVRAAQNDNQKNMEDLSRMQPGQVHRASGLPEFSWQNLPGQLEYNRQHSGHLIHSKVASSPDRLSDPFQPGFGESPWVMGGDVGRRERDEETRSEGEARPLLADEAWGSSRRSNGLVATSHHDQVPDRENALPILHHSGVLRKMNGDFDSMPMGFTDNEKQGGAVEMGHIPPKNVWGGMGIISPSARLSPSRSARMNLKLSGVLSNTAEPAVNTSRSTSQTASGLLSNSGVLHVRHGSASSSGRLSRLQSTINPEEAQEYLGKVADLLLEFSRADTAVKAHMCSITLLQRLLQILNKLQPPILVKILECIKQLSQDPYTLEYLQRAEAMKHLVPLLAARDGPYVNQIHNQVLNALHNLCKINKRRQEQAAECGIIPHLMHFIKINSSLKQFALPLLCDMAHASRTTRDKLRDNNGLEVYLSLLDDEIWAVTALDSLAVCLAHDNEQRKVEQALLQKEAVQRLVAFFQSCGGPSFVHILEPFLKIITKSVRLNTALAVSGLTPLLVARLDHQDAIARLTLLKLIKAVYEHHPRPKQFIVEHDLPAKLQRLIEERRDGERSGGQVLVKQMAYSLLKALHINTVL